MSVELIDSKAFRKFQYGLFVLTAKVGEKDNGCICNSVFQASGAPYHLALSVNKTNLTHDMIVESGMFNLSVLSEGTPFSVFDHFGLHSGRDINKFPDEKIIRMENGVAAVPRYANALFSGKVVEKIDCGTHTLFIAEVTQAKTLSDERSMTYDYYFANVKPKPVAKKKGYVCTICGYIYEGEPLPADFICPLCAHGVEFFEPLK